MQIANSYPASRKEAKRVGSKYYFTGVPCVRGQVSLRLTSGGKCWCRPCRDIQLASDASNRERARSYERAYRQRMAEAGIKRKATRADAERKLRWARENKGRVNHRNALRRKAVKRATPAWADMDAIQAVYEEAAARRAAGERVHVDHIVPLQAETACGLHVHWNLQIIPEYENLSKGNKMTDAQVRGLQRAYGVTDGP